MSIFLYRYGTKYGVLPLSCHLRVFLSSSVRFSQTFHKTLSFVLHFVTSNCLPPFTITANQVFRHDMDASKNLSARQFLSVRHRCGFSASIHYLLQKPYSLCCPRMCFSVPNYAIFPYFLFQGSRILQTFGFARLMDTGICSPCSYALSY